MVGLALEGGGAKGAYQVGAYLALKKNHVKIKAVVGTSIGSFNAALIAANDINKMVELWKDTSIEDLLGIDEEMASDILKNGLTFKNLSWTINEIYKTFKNKGLDISNYRAIIRNNINEDKIRNSKILYGLTTIRLNKMDLLELFIDDIPKGELHDYIVASSFLPCFKKEKLANDAYYLDGGFYNLSPTDMLEKVGCDKIYVVNIQGIGHRMKKKKSDAEIIEIKPSQDLGSIILFDKETNKINMKRGYYDTMKVFDKLDGIKYYFKHKKDRYYKKLNRGVKDELYKAVSIMLNTSNDKELTLKALEYYMDKEKADNMIIYDVKKVLKTVGKDKGVNLIYNYLLSIK